MEGSFYRRVVAIARCIPPGSVATYGQLAFLAGSPRAARVVGGAMAACKDPDVPCHRVVDRRGGTKAAFDTFAPGTQRALLEAEGVLFRPDGTVDLERCLWCPEADFPRRRGAHGSPATAPVPPPGGPEDPASPVGQREGGTGLLHRRKAKQENVTGKE